MAKDANAEVSTPSAEEVFNEYFKKSQSVIGTLNPNIFWQLYSEANPPTGNKPSEVIEGGEQ